MKRTRSGLVVLTLGVLLSACGSEPAPAPPADLAGLAQRLSDPRFESTASAAFWTLIHCASAQEMDKVRPFLEELEKGAKAAAAGDRSAGAALGGAKGVKDRFAAFLTSEDPYVRGWAAVTLGVLADPAYTAPVAALLRRKPAPADAAAQGFDVGRAAMALGMLQARAYEQDLAALLADPRPQVPGSAALGLGYMHATTHAGAIAALLDRADGGPQGSVLCALADLGAKDQAPRIARLLDQGRTRDVDTPGLAAYVLARLGAKQHAGAIAASLGNAYSAGPACIALSVLGATEHVPRIASFLTSADPFARQGAAVAFAILGARERQQEIAALLADKEEFVRPAAAVALLLLDAREHAPAVRQVLSEGAGRAAIAGVFHEQFVANWRFILADEAACREPVAVERWQAWQQAR